MRFTKVSAILTLTALLAIIPVSAQTSESEPMLREELVQQFRLIGTWRIDVTQVISPEFYALQTFHLGGTMNETSDLLAQGGEGPGHGTWQFTDDGYAVTFELFIFNPDRTPAGVIRVRESITLKDANTFTGYAVADIILPDGTLIENIDNGPITGTRVSLMKVRPEDHLPPPPASIGRRRASW